MRLAFIALGLVFILAPATSQAADGVTNKLELAGPCVVGAGGPCNGNDGDDNETGTSDGGHDKNGRGGRSFDDGVTASRRAPGNDDAGADAMVAPSPGRSARIMPVEPHPYPCEPGGNKIGCIKPFPVEPVPVEPVPVAPVPEPRPQPIDPKKPLVYKGPKEGGSGGVPKPVWGSQ